MICPIMSANVIKTDLKDFIPCVTSCAFYIKGNCSISILAQKAIKDAKKEKSQATTESENSGTVE